MTRVALCAMAVAVGAASSAFAETIQLPVTETALMTSPRGLSRVLLRVEDPRASLDDVRVARATLRIPCVAGRDEANVTFCACPVTRSWGGAVDWAQGWERPGGDVDVHRASVTHARPGREDVTLDVTEAVKTAVEWGDPLEGILLAPLPEEREGFDTAELARLALHGAPYLEVDFRRVITRP